MNTTETESMREWDVLVTAIEAGLHGVGTWAFIERYAAEPAGNKHAAVARLVEEETGKRHNVTLRTIRRAFARIEKAKAGQLDVHYTYHMQMLAVVRGLDGGEALDGPLADMIVQVGLFGKVIYG